MRARSAILAAGLSALVFISVRHDLVPWLRGPAPYPPEWQWRYRPRALSRAWPAVPIAAALAGALAWSGTAAARRRPRRSAGLVLTSGVLLGIAFPLALLSGEDGGTIAHLARRTASPGYLSYHAVAASREVDDLARFVREYPQHLATLPVHAATHPPGPVVAFAVLVSFLEERPGLTRTIDRWIARACGEEIDGCGPHLAAVDAPARAAALAGPLVAHLAAVLTLLPIAWLGFQLTRDRLAAARTAALWPLVPGVALFVPALDPALALPVTTALAALRAAITAERPWSRRFAGLAAGAIGAAALYLSYGAAVFLGLGAVAIVASLPSDLLGPRRGRVLEGVLVTAAAGIAGLLAPIAFGHDPAASARVALGIHAGELTAQRSYPLWLVFGPLDFALFLGPPLTVGLLAHVAAAWRRGVGLALTPPPRLAMGTAAALALVFVSGTVRGEVGRLLVPMMPLGLLAGVLRLDDEPEPDAGTAAALALMLAALDLALRLSWRI